MQDVTLSVYSDQRVIVRIWTSGANLNLKEAIGHVSVQTPQQYMSPRLKQTRHPLEQSVKETQGSGFLKPINHELLASLQIDLQYEGRLPEATYCFYSLDACEIEQEFRQVKEQLKGGSVLGLCENSECCASLAYRLLRAGGLEKLVNKVDEMTTGSRESSHGFF